MALHDLVGSSRSSQNVFRILVTVLLILTFVQLAASASTATDSLKAYKKFIKDKCNSTTYPKVCYKSLYPYASQIKRNSVTLTKLSIHVALKAAKSANSTLTKLSNSKGKLTHGETSVIADCRENIDETLDMLEQSAEGLAHLNGASTADEKFQWDSIKTWMSAAITDEGTCTDEFDEIQVRPSLQENIKTTVFNVSWLTTNALALVNRLY
ncbi:pectinesterase inhibitor 4-like [Glycine soja]|uniref:pectinesterase n=1 Tax=Glycine soja TaxID=3848 RepID=A0A445J4Z9_GLYSO|nr:pectinesterase inhibitor 4-like [Glycine soja]RZB93474.1 Pectinesterase inhibitor 4 [Glycine soja]